MMRKLLIKFSVLFWLTLMFSALSPAQDKNLYQINFEKGKTAAAAEIKAGKYVFKGWGLSSSSMMPWPTADQIYHYILKEKYAISFESVGGCTVDDETAAYAEGYNEAIMAGIEAKYGRGILDRVRKEAAEEFEIKYGEKQREFDRWFREGLKNPQPLPKNAPFLEVLKLKPSACSCVPRSLDESLEKQVAEAKDKAAAVFTGKVIEVVASPGKDIAVVKLKLVESFKGELAGEIAVRTGSTAANCGFNFEVGQTYLVYAYETGTYAGDSTPLATGLCSRTARDAAVVGELRILKKKKPR